MTAELQQQTEAPPQETQNTEQPGAETQATAQPEQTTTADGKPPEGEESDKKVRRHVNAIQNRIDELTRNWRGEQRARETVERELHDLRSQLAQAKATSAEPRLEQFKTYDEFVDAKAAWKAEQIVAAKLDEFQRNNLQTFEQRNQQERAAHAAQQFDHALSAVEKDGAAKFKDFAEVVANGPKLGPQVGTMVLQTEAPAEISYYLAKNPEHGIAIASMHPLAAMREIGKLEAQFTSKRVTSAPPPPTTVGQSSKATSGLSDELSAKEWYARRAKMNR